jgi:predicted enzyme related to lactoylglutathione lyase
MTSVCSCCGEAKPLTVPLQCHPDTVICADCLDWLSTKLSKQRAATGRTRIVGTESIFHVSDVARALDHYQRLGFSTDSHDETYAFAHRDNLTVHLTESDGAPAASALYLHVDDADRLAEEWRRAGVAVVGPQDFDYGKREGSHTDPDGNLLRFGSPLRA